VRRVKLEEKRGQSSGGHLKGYQWKTRKGGGIEALIADALEKGKRKSTFRPVWKKMKGESSALQLGELEK